MQEPSRRAAPCDKLQKYQRFPSRYWAANRLGDEVEERASDQRQEHNRFENRKAGANATFPSIGSLCVRARRAASKAGMRETVRVLGLVFHGAD